MQFKEVLVHNIASLKGTHSLKFSPEHFHDNLFAITGPTGSGKSTILAAISLALYGSHYKDKLSTIELITLGETGGRAEVEFFYQGDLYKSIWEGTVLKSNGEPLAKPKIMRTLLKKQGDTYEALNQKIEDILKLSFEQFCKTVILNQGEFNRFITSDFKQRKEILERLADNNKLELLNLRLNEEIKETRNLIENKQNWVAGRQHLTNEDVEALTQKTVNLKNELATYQGEFKELNANNQRFQEIFNNFKIRTENIQRKQTLQEQLNAKNTELNEVKLKFISEQKSYEGAVSDFHKEEPQLRLAEETLVKKQHLAENLAKTTQQKNHKQSLLKTLINEEIVLLDQIELNLKKKKHLSEQIKFKVLTPEEKKLLENLTNLLTEYQQQVSLLKKELELNESELLKKNQAELTLNQELNEISSDLTKLNPTQKSSLTLAEEADQLGQSLFKMEAANAHVTGQMKYFPELSREMISKDSLSKSLAEEKVKIDLKNQKLQFYDLAMSISHCHEESVKTGHCVVCGQNLKTTTLSPQVKEAIQGDLKNESSMLEQLRHQLILKTAAAEKISQILQETNLFTQKDFDNKLAQLKSEKDQLVKLIEEARAFEKSKDLLQERFKILQKNQTEFTQQKKLHSDTMTQLKNQSAQLANLKIEKIKSIEGILREPFQETNLAELIHDLKISAEIDHLTQTGLMQDEQLRNLNQRKINEQLVIKNLETEGQNLHTEIERMDLTIKQLVGDLGYKDPKSLIAEKKSHIEQLLASKNKTQTQHHQAELGVKEFDSRLKMAQEQIDALSNLIMGLFHQFTAESKTLLKREIKLWAINSRYQDFLQGILHNLDFAKAMDTINLETLSLILTQNNETLTILTESIKKIEKEVIEGEATLKTVADQQEQILATTKLIEEKTKVLFRLKNLYDVIGKDDFRNFILSLIEKQLLILANNELKNLCNDRYELVQATRKATGGPEFYVIDKLSGGGRRNIATLSGGETFLISLAMALGLAEMTRGQAEINSFFIDEGFGTLDQDAIGEVLEVLEKMQSTGKQIGVISHIKTLTDRISVNIKLIKNGQGHSNLQIIHN